MPSRTGRCPRWCARNHSADTSGAAFYHASETLSVAVSRAGDPVLPDRLDVQAAQYLPDDPAEPAWPPAIEIAVHAAGRYRLIGLTPSQARELARALARAADMLTALASGTGEEQDEPTTARSSRLACRPSARHDTWCERQIRVAPGASPPSIARSAWLCALASVHSEATMWPSAVIRLSASLAPEQPMSRRWNPPSDTGTPIEGSCPVWRHCSASD
jgi:hypothetical protein